MKLSQARHLSVVAAIVCLWVADGRVAAQAPPSSAHLTASVLPAIHLVAAASSGDTVVLGGVLVLSLRGSSGPRPVTIWSRSAGMSFFEAAPLAGVLGVVNSEEDLGLLLGPGQRQPAVERAMGAHSARTVTTVWQRYQAERQLQTALHDERRTITALLQLWDGQSASPSGAASWSGVAAAVDRQGRRHSQLRTTLEAGSDTRVVGYVLQPPGGAQGRIAHEILVAFDDSTPEVLTVTSEFPVTVSILDRAAARLGDLLGVIGGAVLAFGVFWLQARYSAHVEIEKQFATRKIELSKTIRAFLAPGGNYETLRDTKRAEGVRVQQVRDTLVDEGIYAILPAKDVAALNALCGGRPAAGAEPIRALDTLMRRRFGEFMGELREPGQDTGEPR